MDSARFASRLMFAAAWCVGRLPLAWHQWLGDRLGRFALWRNTREAKVARAMQTVPEGTMDDWVKLAYDDVPDRLWPVAKRSLMAHVERLQSLGGFNL